MAYFLSSYTTSMKTFPLLITVSLGFSAPVSNLHHAIYESDQETKRMQVECDCV